MCWKRKHKATDSLSHHRTKNTSRTRTQWVIQFSADPLLGQFNCSDTVLSNQHSSPNTSHTRARMRTHITHHTHTHTTRTPRTSAHTTRTHHTTHARTHTHTHTRTHARTHARAHTPRTRAHTPRTHAHTHTHTHTHTQWPPLSSWANKELWFKNFWTDQQQTIKCHSTAVTCYFFFVKIYLKYKNIVSSITTFCIYESSRTNNYNAFVFVLLISNSEYLAWLSLM